MKIKQIISAHKMSLGEKIKPFWGFSYWEENSMMVVCYPIPLNWIVAIFRNVYWKFMVAQDKRHEELAKEYNKGYEEGYTYGYDNGYHDKTHELLTRMFRK